MKGYKDNIENITKQNESYRKVLYTGKHSQLVVMSLFPLEEIGLEIHEDNDQFFRFESGVGKVYIDDTVYDVRDGDAVIVPSGAKHNIVNTSDTLELKLYTIYSPAHHKDHIERITKSDATSDSPEYDGINSE